MRPFGSWRSSRLLLASLAVLLLVAAVVVVVVASASSSGASAAVSRPFQSWFQDDQYLVFSPTPTVARTLDTLSSLGVDHLRITVLWDTIAPDPTATAMPKGFDPSNPADYPAGRWAPYDRVVELAHARGMAVDFNVTAPGPLWAMGPASPDAKSANHYRPSASAFGQFVTAVGKRYSGGYSAGAGSTAIPRVNYWSIWNEPNQPGWLSPQWQSVAGRPEMVSPVLYRQYMDAAFAALAGTGHRPGRDTILLGEFAPEGEESTAPAAPIPPMPFVRALYCVDENYRPLTGSSAAALGCPSAGNPNAFVSANPGLFQVSAIAHHPYSFFLAPSAQMSDSNFVPLSDLSRLERGIDAIFSAYGVHRKLPLYLTEYGYETDPPNPYRGVSLASQARYLDEAQYMAWQDPRVQALSQFLLFDSPPDPNFPPGTIGYWSTFQTGLLFASGAPKPSLAAYRLPIYLPDPVTGQGKSVLIWGMLRPAPHDSVQRAQIQWRSASGDFRTLTTVTTHDPNGVLNDSLKLPGPGAVRISWTAPSGQTVYSRAATVS